MAGLNRYGRVRDHFKKIGWPTEKIEVYDGLMHDAFGCADMAVLSPNRIIFVQVCGAKDWKAHIDKIKPLDIVKKHIAPLEVLYQVGVDKRKIGNQDRWVYQIAIYNLTASGEVRCELLNSFKDKHTDLKVLTDYESQMSI